jgi:hypothetical protein
MRVRNVLISAGIGVWVALAFHGGTSLSDAHSGHSARATVASSSSAAPSAAPARAVPTPSPVSTRARPVPSARERAPHSSPGPQAVKAVGPDGASTTTDAWLTVTVCALAMAMAGAAVILTTRRIWARLWGYCC